MILDNLLSYKPEEALIFLERKMNNENFGSNVQETYRPDGPCGGFDIPFVLLKKEGVIHFQNAPDTKLLTLLETEDEIKFFLHPEMILDYKSKNMAHLENIAGSVRVFPTSSTRTVIALGGGYPYMIKTDLVRRIGDGVKRLKRSHLDHIKEIGKDLEEVSINNFGYLPESLGLLFSSCNEEVGMVIREFYARPRIYEGTYLIPFFSLFSKDPASKDDPILLKQLLNKQNDEHNEIDSCLERIIIPYVECWMQLISQRGLCAEMHAQNTLLEVDKYGMPLRVIYRDLQDTFVDLDIRDQRGLKKDFNKGIIGENERLYLVKKTPIKDRERCKQISYSLTYDYRMARALDYFVEAFKTEYSDAEDRIVSGIKNIWNKNFRGMDILPTKAYLLEKKQPNIGKELHFIEADPKYR
ncbi:MAG: ferric iron reductase [Nanoarchaeota archaeon]|nr:ferric iron reductase [Nanoarchaeota archaeon]